METPVIRKLEPPKKGDKTFKNIERLKEILKEAEPLHKTMVSLTEEYGEAVKRIKKLAAKLEGENDGRGD